MCLLHARPLALISRPLPYCPHSLSLTSFIRDTLASTAPLHFSPNLSSSFLTLSLSSSTSFFSVLPALPTSYRTISLRLSALACRLPRSVPACAAVALKSW